MKTGDKLKLVRKSLKLNQGEFAKLLGLTGRPSTISDWEQGKQSPNTDVLRSMVQKLHVNPVWLLLDHGRMFFKDESELGDIHLDEWRKNCLRIIIDECDKHFSPPGTEIVKNKSLLILGIYEAMIEHRKALLATEAGIDLTEDMILSMVHKLCEVMNGYHP